MYTSNNSFRDTGNYFCRSIKERIQITEIDAKVAEWQA
jgi:hypothetical protein